MSETKMLKRFPDAWERFFTNITNVMFRGLPWIHTCTREAKHDGSCNGWVCESIRKRVATNQHNG